MTSQIKNKKIIRARKPLFLAVLKKLLHRLDDATREFFRVNRGVDLLYYLGYFKLTAYRLYHGILNFRFHLGRVHWLALAWLDRLLDIRAY